MRKNKQLATLPEHLSYSTVRIESPLGKIVYLPRRELFDVRAQLLQENSSASDQVVENLDKSDLRSGIYEGGFKTWECSIDLASFLLDRGPRKDIDELVKCDQILEVFVTIHSPYIRRITYIIDMRLTHTSQLGAGSALPSLILFRHAVLHSLSDITFTLADYNEEVLRLITLPNLILTWAAATTTATTTSPESNSNSSSMSFPLAEPSNGDFELTPSLLSNFKTSLQSTNLTLNFLSGPWSPALANLILPSSPSSPSPSPSFSVGEKSLLILASETIYSPTSTAAFVDLVTTLLKRRGGGSGSGGNMGKAVLGAKKMYFGVGGSVDGLKEMCRDRGAVACEVENSGVKGMEGDGVGRALVEIQMF